MNKRSILSCLSISFLTFLFIQPVRAVVSIGPEVIVTGTTIEVLAPGPDLQEIIDGIDDASASKPYLIKLGPGEYTIEADTTTLKGLVMAQYVSLMGSGEGVTILKGAISTSNIDETSAIVKGANDASIRNLTIENTGGGFYSIGVYNDTSSPKMSDLNINVSGGSSNTGIYNTFSSPTMSDLTITASGGASYNYGIVNGDSSSPTMSDMSITTSGGLYSYGVRNASASSTVRIYGSIISASGSSSEYASIKAKIGSAANKTFVSHSVLTGGVLNSLICSFVSNETGTDLGPDCIP